MKLARLPSRVPVQQRFRGQVAVRLAPGAADRKRFYDSALWQQTRAAKLRRDPFCQCCAYDGVVTPGDHVDHWKPLAAGGEPTSDDNLVTMCTPHHSKKTHAEQHGGEYPQFVPSKPRSITFA